MNSQQRAETVKRKVTGRLGRRATFKHAVIPSSEKMLEEMASSPPDSRQAAVRQSSEELQALPEAQDKLREMAAQHWEAAGVAV